MPRVEGVFMRRPLRAGSARLLVSIFRLQLSEWRQRTLLAVATAHADPSVAADSRAMRLRRCDGHRSRES